MLPAWLNIFCIYGEKGCVDGFLLGCCLIVYPPSHNERHLLVCVEEIKSKACDFLFMTGQFIGDLFDGFQMFNWVLSTSSSFGGSGDRNLRARAIV
jgi:hypothetical protein